MSPIHECLYTSVCPYCGYSLAGLPHVGICPECGSYFDQSEIILYGSPRGSHEHLINAKGSRILLPALFLPFAMFGMLFPLALNAGGFQFWLFPFLAVVAGVIIYGLMKRNEIRHPGAIQVRLGEHGCIQYDNLTGPSAVREFRNSYGELVVVLCAITLLILRMRGLIKTEFLWFCLVFLSVQVPWRITWRRIRRLLRRSKNKTTDDARSGHRRQIPWKKATHVLFYKMKPDGYRLRIDCRALGFSNFPVDAEIRCTDEQAVKLKEMLNGWLAMVPDKNLRV